MIAFVIKDFAIKNCKESLNRMVGKRGLVLLFLQKISFGYLLVRQFQQISKTYAP